MMSPLPRRPALLIGVALILAIAIGSLMPAPPLPDTPDSDKIAHLLGYAVLSGWWALLLRSHWLQVLVGASAFGVLIEFLQGQTTYRSFDVYDMLANACGALLGLALAALLGRLIQIRTAS